MRAEGLEPPRA